jgi:hypothetical protein
MIGCSCFSFRSPIRSPAEAQRRGEPYGSAIAAGRSPTERFHISYGSDCDLDPFLAKNAKSAKALRRYSRLFHLRSSATSAVENPELPRRGNLLRIAELGSEWKIGTADFRAEAQRRGGAFAGQCGGRSLGHEWISNLHIQLEMFNMAVHADYLLLATAPEKRSFARASKFPAK